VTLLQSHEVARLVVRSAFDPAAVQYADPLEGERPQGSLVAHPASFAGLVEGLGPESAEIGPS
jgi:hypothetical protein